jgi:purine-binding chemotaxis protein CheW
MVDGETTLLGALADSVEEVVELKPGQIGPPPRIGTHLNTDFIRGMAKRDDGFIIIVDIDKVFSSDELLVLQGGDEGAKQHGRDPDVTGEVLPGDLMDEAYVTVAPPAAL